MLNDFDWIGKELLTLGLIGSHSGNMSVRADDKILITKRNSMLAHLKEDDIIEVPLNESSPNDELASRELIVHRAIYKATNAGSILHAHPPYAIAVSITDNRIQPADAEGCHFISAVPVVWARELIGSEDIARLAPQFISNTSPVIVVKGHGSFAIGENLEKAYQWTSCLENSCKVLVFTRLLGHKGYGQQPQQGPTHQPKDRRDSRARGTDGRDSRDSRGRPRHVGIISVRGSDFDRKDRRR
ncbi:MAG: aldolase [bacterium]